MQEQTFKHTPVMLSEVLQCLEPAKGDIFLDCTLGGAGHSAEVAKLIGKRGTLIGIDQDRVARKAAFARLTKIDCEICPNVFVEDSNFSEIDSVLLRLFEEKMVQKMVPGIKKLPGLDAVLFDLGVSSVQLDEQSRGFTYHPGAPLDMRMDQDSGKKTAEDLINTLDENELERILRVYGEEKFSRQIAKNIFLRRQVSRITKSDELVEIIKDSIPASKRRSGGHPAKRSFQALRIAVNDELSALEKGLDAAIRWLLPGGKICVISYHSLEDRLVKDKFRRLENRCTCPIDSPVCTCAKEPILKCKPRGALTPNEEEVERNPRARSAKLRCAVKLK